MTYRLVLSERIRKQIRQFPKPVRRQIGLKLESLRSDPRPAGAEKLTEEESYRVRIGDYRIVYDIQDDQLIVTVVRVGNRKDVYRP